jgi:hypothetical protein
LRRGHAKVHRIDPGHNRSREIEDDALRALERELDSQWA